MEASETTFYLTKSENVAGGFLGGSVVKNPPPDLGDAGSVHGLGRSPRVENGNLLQYSGLENSMLTGYSPWVCKESDTTEHTHTHTHTVKDYEGCPEK